MRSLASSIAVALRAPFGENPYTRVPSATMALPAMPPDLDDRVLAAALARYLVAPPSVAAPIEASKRNDSFLVEDALGRRYVLRRYRRNPDERRIRFQLAFQQHLHRLGYPTSEIIPSNAGDLLVDAEAGPWVLFSYIDGAEYDFASMGQVREAGRQLAEFHTITASIALEDVVIDINPDVRRWCTRGEDELAALETMFRDDGVGEELAFLRGWLAELMHEWPLARLGALPAGWVHSDFHGRNMVFVGDELAGLFDFDPLHRGLWVEDVAHALFMFSREFRGSTHIRPEAARLFLDAYESVRLLSPHERDAIPMMAVLAWAPTAAYQELHRRDGEDTVAFFRDYVVLMRELQAQAEDIARLFTAR